MGYSWLGLDARTHSLAHADSKQKPEARLALNNDRLDAHAKARATLSSRSESKAGKNEDNS